MKQILVELQESMGNDRRIAESAWTSSTTYDNKQLKTDEQVTSLVNRLADEGHATPFESVVFRFWIKMPISVDRQHMTHRIASHNGMSGRYRTMPTEFFLMPDDVRNVSRKALTGIYGQSEEVEKLIYEYQHHCTTANLYYQKITKTFKQAKANNSISNDEYKRLREFYRGVLPQHNITERVTVMNLRSFSNYQHLRNSEYAQPEIRRVAELMLEAVKAANVCPIALAALEKNNWEI